MIEILSNYIVYVVDIFNS